MINRPLNEIVLLDNAPYSYINQLENGVPILPYTGGEDDQLTRLERYLEMLAGVEDVRVRNREWFQLGRYVGEKDVAKVIDSLYFS